MSSLTARQRTLAAIDSLGLDWDEADSVWGGLHGSLYSPKGLMFSTTLCHSVRVEEDSRSAGWKFLADEIAGGLEPCTDEECDTCLDR